MTQRISLPPKMSLMQIMEDIYKSHQPLNLSSLSEVLKSITDRNALGDLLGGDYVREGNIWVSADYMRSDLHSLLYYSLYKTSGAYEVVELPKKQESVFEVNLAEALVGWRKWYVEDGLLQSLTTNEEWKPLQALEARCHPEHVMTNNPHAAVQKDCSCGIYGSDNEWNIRDLDGEVMGEIYGWGRYIRGDKGWRAQFAYPKSFHLDSTQEHLVPVLKKYRVPIHILTPIQIYSPAEDGYDEYRQDNPNWHIGADEDSGAAEDHEEGSDSPSEA